MLGVNWTRSYRVRDPVNFPVTCEIFAPVRMLTHGGSGKTVDDGLLVACRRQ